jgi:hypothetical protein
MWVEHDAVRDFFKQLRPSFMLPSRKHLATTLLEAVYQETRGKVRDLLQTASFYSLTSDGRTQSEQKILNFCLMAAKHNIFLDALPCGSEKVSGGFIYNAIKDVLDWHEVDEKTVAFVSDTRSDMKVAWNLLKNGAMLSICCSVPCWNHVLSLFLRDLVSKIKAIYHIRDWCAETVNFVRGSNKRNALFQQVQHEKLETTGISLKLPVVRRWASTYISMHSLLANNSVCHAFVVDERFSALLPKTKNGRNLAREIKQKVINDSKWETLQMCMPF